MKRLCSVLIISIFISTFALTSIASAAPKPQPTKPVGGGTTQNTLGIDISWPQCGSTSLPTNPAFVVVGVNDGLANNTNRCFVQQLVYAKNSATGIIPSQDKIQLYVNTANPGGLGTPSWPSSNLDPAGNLAPNPFGLCDNRDTLACAWQYGWNRAVEDVVERFTPAATQAGISNVAGDYLWWLDVETENSWKLNGSQFSYQSNVAVLEAMTAYFESQTIEVGLYSTGAQWAQIVGNQVSGSSNLNGLKNWRPGGANLKTAKRACTAAPLTTGGTIIMTQFIANNLDNNYTC